MSQLNGKRILVTGGSRGFGRGMPAYQDGLAFGFSEQWLLKPLPMPAAAVR